MIWKLYLIDLIGGLAFLAFIVSLVTGFGVLVRCYQRDIFDEDVVFDKKSKRYAIIALVSILIVIFVPSKKLIYTSQVVSEIEKLVDDNGDVKEISTKTLKIIINKLDKYLEDEEQQH